MFIFIVLIFHQADAGPTLAPPIFPSMCFNDHHCLRFGSHYHCVNIGILIFGICVPRRLEVSQIVKIVSKNMHYNSKLFRETMIQQSKKVILSFINLKLLAINNVSKFTILFPSKQQCFQVQGNISTFIMKFSSKFLC